MKSYRTGQDGIVRFGSRPSSCDGFKIFYDVKTGEGGGVRCGFLSFLRHVLFRLSDFCSYQTGHADLVRLGSDTRNGVGRECSPGRFSLI